MFDAKEIDQTSVLLEKRRYVVLLCSELGSTARDSLDYREQENYEMQRLCRQLKVDILAHKLVGQTYTKTKEVSFPSSWWQHFKQDHMPGWYIKHWPVKTTNHELGVSVEFERYVGYPDADILFDGRYGRAFVYEAIKDKEMWYA